MKVNVKNSTGIIPVELNKDGENKQINFKYSLFEKEDKFYIRLVNLKHDIEIEDNLSVNLYYNAIVSSNDIFAKDIKDQYITKIKEEWYTKFPQKIKFSHYNIDTDNKYVEYHFNNEKGKEQTVKISFNRNMRGSSSKINKDISDNTKELLVSTHIIDVVSSVDVGINTKILTGRVEKLSFELVLQNQIFSKIFNIELTEKEFINKLTKYIADNHGCHWGDTRINLDKFIPTIPQYNTIIADYINYVTKYFDGTFNIRVKSEHCRDSIYNLVNLSFKHKFYINTEKDYTSVSYGWEIIEDSQVVRLIVGLRSNCNDITSMIEHTSLDDFINMVKVDKFGLVDSEGTTYPSLTSYGKGKFLKMILKISETFELTLDNEAVKRQFTSSESIASLISDDLKWKYLSEVLLKFEFENDTAKIKFKYEIDDTIGVADQVFTGDNLLSKIYNFLTKDNKFKIIKCNKGGIVNE